VSGKRNGQEKAFTAS